MLSLFKDAPETLDQQNLLIRARELLVSSLNKGQIPTWEEFFSNLPLVTNAEDLDLLKSRFDLLTEWSFLREALAIGGTEFFFHDPEKCQRVLLSGEKVNFEVPLNSADWQLWLEIISIKFHQNWNVQNPFCSFFAELFGKTYRLSMIHASTSPQKKSKLTIRSLAQTPHPLESFGSVDLLPEFVKSKKNILVAGSTGSGKTSLLSSLLPIINAEEHLVILEDTYEILSDHTYQTRLLAGDSEQTSLKSYLAYCMRLSPDRIILGEMRSHEVIPFLMAMNTGHKGLMGTLHASSAFDALHRVSLLFSLYSGESSVSFEKVMDLLCRNLDYVVFMENKKVKEIIKVIGSDRGEAFFENVL